MRCEPAQLPHSAFEIPGPISLLDFGAQMTPEVTCWLVAHPWVDRTKLVAPVPANGSTNKRAPIAFRPNVFKVQFGIMGFGYFALGHSDELTLKRAGAEVHNLGSAVDVFGSEVAVARVERHNMLVVERSTWRQISGRRR